MKTKDEKRQSQLLEQAWREYEAAEALVRKTRQIIEYLSAQGVVRASSRRPQRRCMRRAQPGVVPAALRPNCAS